MMILEGSNWRHKNQSAMCFLIVNYLRLRDSSTHDSTILHCPNISLRSDLLCHSLVQAGLRAFTSTDDDDSSDTTDASSAGPVQVFLAREFVEVYVNGVQIGSAPVDPLRKSIRVEPIGAVVHGLLETWCADNCSSEMGVNDCERRGDKREQPISPKTSTASEFQSSSVKVCQETLRRTIEKELYWLYSSSNQTGFQIHCQLLRSHTTKFGRRQHSK